MSASVPCCSLVTLLHNNDSINKKHVAVKSTGLVLDTRGFGMKPVGVKGSFSRPKKLKVISCIYIHDLLTNTL